MKKMTLLLSCFSVVACLQACDKKSKDDTSEELTIVVEADRSKIAEEDKALRAKMAEFSKQRERLRKEKEQLMSSMAKMKGNDQVREKRLEALLRKEKEMWSREAAIEKERKQLANQKNELLGKIKTSGTRETSNSVQREATVARREKDFARRERELAEREKDLARREAELARREAGFLKMKSSLSAYRAPRVAASRHGGQAVSRQKAERAYKKVLARMRKRGILSGDLPLESSGLTKDVKAAQKEGDFGRMLDLAEQLRGIVKACRIDSAFIDRKFARLAQLTKEKKPAGGTKQSVSNLLRKATQLYSDGKFAKANRELNRIFVLLTR